MKRLRNIENEKKGDTMKRQKEINKIGTERKRNDRGHDKRGK